MHTSSRLLAAALFAALPYSAFAVDFDFRVPVSEADFEDITEDLTGAYSYKGLSPAEPAGIAGFDVGVTASYTPVENKDAWERTTLEEVDYLPMVGITASKGLPFGFDVGGFVTAIPDTDAIFYGVNASYALAEGGIIGPALALRGSYTELTGVDDFDFSSAAVDLSISKGFAMVTPYGGLGYVRGSAETDNGLTGNIDADVNATKAFAGLRISLIPFMLTIEGDKTGDNQTISAKIAFGI